MKCKYKLNELDCAACANKIEKKLNKDKNIENAVVNYSKLTISLETNLTNNVKEYVEKIVKEVEPDVKLYNPEDVSLDIKKTTKKEIIRLLGGSTIALIGTFLLTGLSSQILIILGFIILLYRVALTALKLLKNSHTINENFLLTISCIGAYLTGNITEGLMVIILYEIGKILEGIAVNNTRQSISDLMDIKPEYANLKEKKSYKKVSPEEVKINDIIIIKQGEKVPLDGIVIKGEAKLNTSALTGESKLKNVKTNDEVLSGSINHRGLIELKVTNNYNDSTVSKILELVETATDRKAKTETFVSKASRIYTPTVLILSILTFILLPTILNISYNTSLYRALVFLVVSCPCAIAISVPLSYFTGIGKSSKEGILIKGSDYLDALSNITKIIFDKTGTITTGSFTDYTLTIIDTSYDKDIIISYYVSGETLSNHPIAKSIIKIFGETKPNHNINSFKEVTGKGITYKLNKDTIKIGTPSFCNSKENGNEIYLSINDKVIAKLDLLDGLKEDSEQAIKELKKLGIITKIFTGDSKEIAATIGKKINVDEIKSELLPTDKYTLLEKEIKDNKEGKTAFVGDGINDAPSLARADIGISMGGIGSASAIESSDVVIMTDELTKITEGIKISKFTNKIIKQNLIFAISVKIIVLLLSALGLTNMIAAVFADTGLTLLTILNTGRISKYNPKR